MDKIKPLTCEEFKQLLPADLEGLLDPIQKLRVEQHFNSCRKCRKKRAKEITRRAFSLGLLNAIKERPIAVRECLNSETINEYLKGKLTYSEQKLVEEHLKRCERCMEFTEWKKSVIEENIESQPELLPELLREKILIKASRDWDELGEFDTSIASVEQREQIAYAEAQTKRVMETEPVEIYARLDKIDGITGEIVKIGREWKFYLNSKTYEIEGVKITLCKKTKDGSLRARVTKVTNKNGEINFGKINLQGHYVVMAKDLRIKQ